MISFNRKIKEFILEQSKLVRIDDLDSVVEALEDCYDYDVILLDEIWAGLKVYMICYIRDGKFDMETYENTLEYYFKVIRKSSDNPLMKTLDYIIA